MIKRTCRDRNCQGSFYHWTDQQHKFIVYCPYCGKKLKKMAQPQPAITIDNCQIIDGQLIDSEGKRVPIELYKSFSLTMIKAKS